MRAIATTVASKTASAFQNAWHGGPLSMHEQASARAASPASPNNTRHGMRRILWGTAVLHIIAHRSPIDSVGHRPGKLDATVRVARRGSGPAGAIATRENAERLVAALEEFGFGASAHLRKCGNVP